MISKYPTFVPPMSDLGYWDAGRTFFSFVVYSIRPQVTMTIRCKCTDQCPNENYQGRHQLFCCFCHHEKFKTTTIKTTNIILSLRTQTQKCRSMTVCNLSRPKLIIQPLTSNKSHWHCTTLRALPDAWNSNQIIVVLGI